MKRFIYSFLSILIFICTCNGFMESKGISVIATTYAAEQIFGDFQYRIIGSGVEITKYTGKSANVTVPSTIDGRKVVSIGFRSFQACFEVKKIVLPEGITNISNEAFEFCQQLSAIHLPNSLKIIGEFAFDSTGLKSIVIPAGVSALERQSFSRCKELTSVTLSKGLETIGAFSFSDCSKLSSIKIPDTVTTIGEGAFAATNLSSVVISQNVSYIGYDIFGNCSNLKKLVVDSRNKNYASENNALYNKEKSVLIFHPFQDEIYVRKGVKVIASYALFRNTVKKLILPKGLETIEEWGIAACENLNEIKIPVTVKAIKDYAFTGSLNIKKITIPSSVTSIGSNAFMNIAHDSMFKIDATLFVYPYTYAYQYALENDFDYNILHYETPSPVSGLNAKSLGTNSIQLTWKGVEGVDGYLIYRQNSQKKYSYCGMSDTSVFTDNKAATGEHNFYWVFPYIDVDETQKLVGSPGKYVYATPIPASTNNVKAVADGATIKLTWDKVNDVDGYIIYRQLPYEKNMRYRYTVTGAGFIDSAAQLDGFNFYRIYPYKKVNGKNVTAISNQYVYAKPTLTNVTKLKAIGKTNKQIQISWNKYSGADGYIVTRQDPNTKQFKYRLMTTSTGFIDTVEKANTYYYYRVYPYKNVNGKRVIGTSNTYVYAKSK